MTVATPQREAGSLQTPLVAPNRWITWRSVLLGTAGVTTVSALAPFNDFVVANTFMIGSYLPLAVVLTFFVLIVVVNGPLHRLAPRRALQGGELGVIMAMMLTGCAIPTQGLMRYFLPMLVAPFHFGRSTPRFWEAFERLDLPDWMFPVAHVKDGRTSSIATDFYNRVQDGVPIPYAAWIVPLLGWGLFLAAMVAVLVALAVIVRRQWAVNERLPFPIARLESALIEPPRPGKMLNELLASRLFWAALLAVFCIQSLVALNRYFPKHVPELPMSYNLWKIMSEEPWTYFAGAVKQSTVYFTFIGISYFIQSRIGFSLWSIFLITEIIRVQFRVMQVDVAWDAWRDQHVGACVAYLGGVAWVGRRYWWNVFSSRGGHRTAMTIVCIGLAIMIAWLLAVGVQWWVALFIIGFILLGHLVTSRIVAETGLPFVRTDALFSQVYTNFPTTVLSGRDVFFSGVFTAAGPVTTRESVTTFSLHALQVNESTEPPDRQRPGLIVLMAWSLILAFVVSAASSLWSYYSYATPLTPRVQNVLNSPATEDRPRGDVVDPLVRHSQGQFAPKQHSPFLQMGIGAAVTGLLQVGALRWSSWPFMPVGFLLSSTWYIQTAWFSLFIGWLAKVLLVKYGGARLYQQGRPVFVGLIFGEALAAGVWLIITLVLAGMGVDYQPIEFLPH